MKVISLRAIGICVLFVASVCSRQSNNQQGSLSKQALEEYKTGRYAAAEQDCRELVKRNPSNILAQIYLGQSLYMQKKYGESIASLRRHAN